MPTQLRTALFWIFAQLPLLGGALATVGGPDALWARMQANPAGALLIALGYEAFLAASGIAKQVWSNLEPGVVKALTDWVRAGFLNVASRYRRRYLRQVFYDHELFNTRGLRKQGPFRLKLEHVFVELKLAPNSAEQVSLDPLECRELAGNRPIFDFLRQIAKHGAVALAVLGPPGSGKTTLLQHVALTLARNRQRRHRLRAYVPLFLFLRDHVKEIAAREPPTLADLVQGYIAKRSHLAPPPRWFEGQLLAGKCMVLLDGLDEVGDKALRERVASWVDTQIKAYPRSPFVLSARPQGYREAPLERAHVLEVQPFGAEQAQAFVRSWYLANEIMASNGEQGEGVRQRAAAQAEDLLERLRRRPALGDLTRNPLLLTMITTVHSTRNALPGRRVELYAEICDVQLGHWQASKGLSLPLTAAQLRVVLEPLAAHMMEARTPALSAADALRIVKEPLARVGVAGDAAESFLSDLQERSGMFLERERDRWGFSHLTFQEYLAAGHLRAQPGQRDWNPLIEDGWWHETLRLYAAQGDATPLLRSCLDADTVATLSLASDLLEEAREIEQPVRAEATRRLSADLEADDPARRRLAAEVRLSRRLRALHRIDERREIDLDYVTCAEYQLFLDEQRAHGRPCRPDHWTDERFPSGHAQEPVRGVRVTDAERFCEWLGAREGGQAQIRLPTPEEADAAPAHDEQTTAAWCKSEGKVQLIGLNSEAAQTLLVEVRKTFSTPGPASFTRDLPFALAFDRALAPDRTLHLVLTLDVDPALVRAQARDLDIEFDPELARVLGRELARLRSRARAQARAHALGDDPARAQARRLALARVLTPVRARTRARARALDGALDLAIALVRDCIFDFGSVIDAIDYGNVAHAREWIRPLLRSPSRSIVCIGTILLDLMALLHSSAPAMQRRAWYSYGAHLTTYAWNGRGDASEHEHEVHGAYAAVLALHWFCQMQLARLTGTLPAWEGIRLVRERTG